jgi:hypothetical protein
MATPDCHCTEKGFGRRARVTARSKGNALIVNPSAPLGVNEQREAGGAKTAGTLRAGSARFT